MTFRDIYSNLATNIKGDWNKAQDAIKRAIEIIRKKGRPALIDMSTQFF